MTVMHATRALWLLRGVEPENHLDDLAPVGTFLIGIEQPQVGFEMPFIVRREMRLVRG
jgi:hypothetical protein